MADIEQLRRSFTFKTTAAGLPIQLDLQVKPESITGQPLPVIISYHGGGLFVGSRNDPMYEELARPFLDAGYAIVYPDYRLLDPSSCWDELSDVRDALQYLFSPRFAEESGVQLDNKRVCLAGFSAGCYLARIAAIHVIKAMREQVKLSCLLLYFGMGGDFLLDYWIQPMAGLQIVKPPHLTGAAPPLPENASASYTPGIPSYEYCAARSAVSEWYWTCGDLLDLCFARPGLAQTLRSMPYEARLASLVGQEPDLEDVLPALFLHQSDLAKYWPSTLLVHGSADPLVPLAESETTKAQLEKLRVPVRLHLVEGGNHNLDSDALIAAGDPRITEAKMAAFSDSIAYVGESFKL